MVVLSNQANNLFFTPAFADSRESSSTDFKSISQNGCEWKWTKKKTFSISLKLVLATGRANKPSYSHPRFIDILIRFTWHQHSTTQLWMNREQNKLSTNVNRTFNRKFFLLNTFRKKFYVLRQSFDGKC